MTRDLQQRKCAALISLGNEIVQRCVPFPVLSRLESDNYSWHRLEWAWVNFQAEAQQLGKQYVRLGPFKYRLCDAAECLQLLRDIGDDNRAEVLLATMLEQLETYNVALGEIESRKLQAYQELEMLRADKNIHPLPFKFQYSQIAQFNDSLSDLHREDASEKRQSIIRMLRSLRPDWPHNLSQRSIACSWLCLQLFDTEKHVINLCLSGTVSDALTALKPSIQMAHDGLRFRGFVLTTHHFIVFHFRQLATYVFGQLHLEVRERDGKEVSFETVTEDIELMSQTAYYRLDAGWNLRKSVLKQKSPCTDNKKDTSE